MALPTLLALLGTAGLYTAGAGPWQQVLASRRTAVRAGSLALLATSAGTAVASRGAGIGLTLFVLTCMAALVALAIAAPLRPRLAARALGLASLALAAAAMGGA